MSHAHSDTSTGLRPLRAGHLLRQTARFARSTLHVAMPRGRVVFLASAPPGAASASAEVSS